MEHATGRPGENTALLSYDVPRPCNSELIVYDVKNLMSLSNMVFTKLLGMWIFLDR